MQDSFFEKCEAKGFRSGYQKCPKQGETVAMPRKTAATLDISKFYLHTLSR
jgi:hypothetical protein